MSTCHVSPYLPGKDRLQCSFSVHYFPQNQKLVQGTLCPHGQSPLLGALQLGTPRCCRGQSPKLGAPLCTHGQDPLLGALQWGTPRYPQGPSSLRGAPPFRPKLLPFNPLQGAIPWPPCPKFRGRPLATAGVDVSSQPSKCLSSGAVGLSFCAKRPSSWAKRPSSWANWLSSWVSWGCQGLQILL